MLSPGVLVYMLASDELWDCGGDVIAHAAVLVAVVKPNTCIGDS